MAGFRVMALYVEQDVGVGHLAKELQAGNGRRHGKHGDEHVGEDERLRPLARVTHVVLQRRKDGHAGVGEAQRGRADPERAERDSAGQRREQCGRCDGSGGYCRCCCHVPCYAAGYAAAGSGGGDCRR